MSTLQDIASAAGFKFGTPYNLNWRTSGIGIDCSGFVSAVARHFGATNIAATDWTGSLFPKTQAITQSQLTPGDLVFFGNPNDTNSHVAIYAGNNQVLNSSTGIGGVGTSSLSGLSSFYHGAVQYRRIPQLTQGFSSALTGGTVGGSTTSGDNTTSGDGTTGGAGNSGTSTTGTGATGADGIKIGNVGGADLGVPSGLVIGFIGVLLFVIGAIMFSSAARSKVNDATGGSLDKAAMVAAMA